MNEQLVSNVHSCVLKFTQWIKDFGETSQDWQDFYASKIGNKAKLLYYRRPFIGTIAVVPMVFCEAFVPAMRKFFWRKQRFPIADAHFSMGFAYLSQISERELMYEKAVHFLSMLEQSRCANYERYCWGYPFNWETIHGVVHVGTPLITITPYAYEAFALLYEIDHDSRWLEIMHSIADHVLYDIKDIEVSGNLYSCAYGPHDHEGGVINASAYRSYLLTHASVQFSEEKYRQAAKRNLEFVLKSQQPDGSWCYAADGVRNFVDHFHTCFVLKALEKIEQLTGDNHCQFAIENGVHYYLEHLFDENGLPKPFSVAPRLTIYRRELYDYAECINVSILLRKRIGALENTLNVVVTDVLNRWIKEDGSFRSRELLIGWDNVPMHRWAQSQLFRSLCLLLYDECGKDGRSSFAQ